MEEPRFSRHYNYQRDDTLNIILLIQSKFEGNVLNPVIYKAFVTNYALNWCMTFNIQ